MWLCRGRVTAPGRPWPPEELAVLPEVVVVVYIWADHLCNKWVILFVLYDPGDRLDEGIRSFHQCFQEGSED